MCDVGRARSFTERPEERGPTAWAWPSSPALDADERHMMYRTEDPDLVAARTRT